MSTSIPPPRSAAQAAPPASRGLQAAPRGRHDATRGRLARVVLALAVPILGVSALEVVRSAVELKVLGILGPADMDAVITINQTFRQFFMTFVIATAWGASAMVAQRMGAREVAEAGRTLGQALGIVLLVAGAAALLANAATGPVLGGLGVTGAIALKAAPFLRLTGLLVAASFLFFVLMSTLQAAGDVLTPLLMVLLNTVVQLVALALLPLGAGPVPGLGILGVVTAGAIANVAAFLLGMARVRRLHADLGLHLRSLLVQDWRLVGRIARLSWPVMVQISCRAVAIIVMMRLLGTFGPTARAGYGVALRIDLMLLSIGLAFAGAAATVTGQNVGAGDFGRADRGAWIACGYYAAVLACCTAGFWWKAEAVIGAFAGDPEVIAVGARYLRISSAAYPFLAAGFVFTRAMQGAGDMRRPMWATLVTTFGVFGPLALWLPRMGTLGFTGVFLAAAAWTVSGGLLQTGLFLHGAWRTARA